LLRRHGEQSKNEAEDSPRRHAPKGVTEDISELLAGYSLNALTPEDADFINRYLDDRPAWQAELTGYERVSELLAYANPPQQVSVRARAGILARIDALAIESQEEAHVRSQLPIPIGERWRRWKRSAPKLAWAAAVPSTIVAIIFVMTSIVMQDRISEQQGQLAAFQQEQSKAIDHMLPENSLQQVVELVESSAAPLARGRLYIDQHNNTAMLVVRDMPQPAEGQVYTVWVLTGMVNEEYVQLGTLNVDSFGRGQKILDPPDSFNRYLNVRITIEPADDLGIPTGPEVMTGGI
jgi:hypothetical protein